MRISVPDAQRSKSWCGVIGQRTAGCVHFGTASFGHIPHSGPETSVDSEVRAASKGDVLPKKLLVLGSSFMGLLLLCGFQSAAAVALQLSFG